VEEDLKAGIIIHVFKKVDKEIDKKPTFSNQRIDERQGKSV